MEIKPTYTELENRLREAEEIIDTLRNHKVDAVIGTDQISTLQLKQVEDLLREQAQISANRLKEIESIYQNVPVGLCVLDRDLKFVRVNKRLAEMNGIPAEEHLGRTVRELLPELAEIVEDELRQVIETGEPLMNIELNGETPAKPGVERSWMEHWLPLFDNQGQVVGLNMVVEEITERKHAEEELKALNETLEERVQQRTSALLAYQEQLRSLASELSQAEERERQRLATELHDNLGQLLTMCKMKLDLLQRGKSSDREASRMADLAGLMDEAIRYTRELMSELKPPPALDTEDLATTMHWVVNKMSKHGLDVTIDDDGRPKPLSKEVRTTLLQSVRELLFNVVKHAGVDEARIELTRLEEHVQVSVEDEGRGFDNRWKRPAPTIKGGYGLFNLHERMSVLGGNLEIHSEPGKGTKVILTVPLKQKFTEMDKPDGGDRKTSMPPDPSLQTALDQKIRVLLVDDHQMVRTGLRKIIEEEEDLTVVAEASDGWEAVELARSTFPDVIIMDVNMPGMNGIEATREIVSDISNVRVIALSLHDGQDVARAMRSAGASAYLTKAEVFETLCATIRSEATMVKKYEQ